METYKLGYKLYGCKVYNSTITTVPKYRQELATPLLNMQFISTYATSISEQSLVNLTALQVEVMLDFVEFRGQSDDSPYPQRVKDYSRFSLGLYVYGGIYYNLTGQVTYLAYTIGRSDWLSDETSIRITNSRFASLFQVSCINLMESLRLV